jgi:uncharacterized protein YoxC
MIEHAQDLIPGLLAIIGFFAVYTLNGIKSEIKEVKTSLQSLETDLREGVTSLDRRVSVIEARCSMKHQHDAP